MFIRAEVMASLLSLQQGFETSDPNYGKKVKKSSSESIRWAVTSNYNLTFIEVWWNTLSMNR
jgi:hypothetical protein